MSICRWCGNTIWRISAHSKKLWVGNDDSLACPADGRHTPLEDDLASAA
jgi:hypothetical protein